MTCYSVCVYHVCTCVAALSRREQRQQAYLLLRVALLVHLYVQNAFLFIRLRNQAGALILVRFEFLQTICLHLYVEQALLLRLAHLAHLLVLNLLVPLLRQVGRTQLLLKVTQLRRLLSNPSNFKFLFLSLKILALQRGGDGLVLLLHLPLLSKLLLILHALLDLHLSFAVTLLALTAHCPHTFITVHGSTDGPVLLHKRLERTPRVVRLHDLAHLAVIHLPEVHGGGGGLAGGCRFQQRESAVLQGRSTIRLRTFAV